MKIMIDTNIIISAVLFPGGKAAQALYKAIRNYILPLIGDVKLEEINTLFLEKYYQTLQTMPAVVNPITGKSKGKYVGTGAIRDVHKLLRNCFEQAVKWELMDRNPASHATVPKHKKQERDIWTVDTLAQAVKVCRDDLLSLAINLGTVAK